MAQVPALLPGLSGPAALRDLDDAELRQLCREIRTTIIETVATTGGHLGSSLGAVELAVALHRILDSPRDLIVLNDNEMSISRTVGALSGYLSRIKLSRTWNVTKLAYDDLVRRVPFVGRTLLELSRRLRKSVVNFAQPGQLFEDLGVTYIGPVNGHDLGDLDGTL